MCVGPSCMSVSALDLAQPNRIKQTGAWAQFWQDSMVEPTEQAWTSQDSSVNMEHVEIVKQTHKNTYLKR